MSEYSNQTTTYTAGYITAYGAAKQGGYTGTYEEFCAALAGLSTAISDLENLTVTISTLPAGSTATASYANGVLTLGIPKGDKGDQGDQGVPGEVQDDIIADEFSSSTAYTKGTMVMKESVLYRFTADHAAGAWTGTDVETVQIGEELTGINEDVTDLKSHFYDSLPTDTASGAIASFPDGANDIPVKDLTVNIEPVQDLHGYSNPWPAGGGKNKFNIDNATSSDFSISGETFTNTSTDSRTSFLLSWQVFNNNTLVTYATASPVSGKVTATLTINDPCTRVVIKHNGSARDLSINFPWAQTGTWTISMDVVSGDPTTVGGLVLSNIQIESGSTATSFVPYSNICPITGWTGANVYRTGVNVWDEVWESGYINTSTGEIVPDVSKIRTKNPISVKPNTTYYYKTPVAMYICSYDKDMNFIQRMGGGRDTTFTTPVNCAFIMFGCESAYGTTYNHDISINYPSTDHDYHAYSGTTYPISWQIEAGTVYGGRDEIVSGELTSTMDTVNMGTLNWQYESSQTYPYFWAYGFASNAKVPGDNNTKANILCSQYKTITANEGYGGTESMGVCINTSPRLIVYDQRYTDKNTFASAMDGVQLVYELATPVTNQLDPVTLRTLLGQNNIWADTGDVEVTYKADVQKYIEKMLSS